MHKSTDEIIAYLSGFATSLRFSNRDLEWLADGIQKLLGDSSDRGDFKAISTPKKNQGIAEIVRDDARSCGYDQPTDQSLKIDMGEGYLIDGDDE